MRGEQRLQTVQVGRGLAALAVVLFHAGVLTASLVAPLPAWLASVLGQGYLGVDYFFVTSGFIIMAAHGADGRDAVGAYALKRISRIYIPYLPAVGAIIAAYLLLPDLSRTPREWGWATSLLLVPSNYPSAMLAAWTLVHEMIFYTVFLLFFVGAWAIWSGLALWAGAIVAAYVGSVELSGPMAILLHPINLEFMLGLLCAVGYRRLPARFGPALLVGGAAAAAVCFVVADDGPVRALFAGGSAAVLLGAALMEPVIRPHIPKSLVQLGDASYSVYLVHNPAISITSRFLARLPLQEMWPVAIACSVGVAVTAGLAYHFWFERPALDLIRSKRRTPIPAVG